MLKGRGGGFFLAVIASATFGLIPLFTLPLLAAGVSVETALVYRFSIAAIVMWPILKLRGERFMIRGIDVLKLLCLGAFYLFAVLLFFYSFSFIASGLAATLQFLYPVIVMLIMILFFHERFYWHVALAIAFAVAGVAFLSWAPSLEPVIEPGAGQPIPDHASGIFWGVALALLSGLGNSLYYVGLQVARIPNISGLVMTFYVMVFGALICLANAIICGSLHWISGFREIGLACMLAIVTAVISNLTLIMSIKRIGSTLAAVIGVVEPLTAVLVGTLVFGEVFNIWVMCGFALVVSAVLIVMLWPKNAGKNRESGVSLPKRR